MESVIAAAVTGALTLVGVPISNSRSQAVIEVKLDELSSRVDKHNNTIERTYRLEQDVAVIRNDIERCGRRYDSGRLSEQQRVAVAPGANHRAGRCQRWWWRTST